MDDVQRSLGRIEGTQQQILAAISGLQTEFAAHQLEDEQRFVAYGKIVTDLAQDNNRAKGAGWVILALVSAGATAIGTSAYAVISGWFKLHT